MSLRRCGRRRSWDGSSQTAIFGVVHCFFSRSRGSVPADAAPASPLQERDELEVRRQAAELERLRLDTSGRSAAGRGAAPAGRGAGGALGEGEADDEDDEGEEGL